MKRLFIAAAAGIVAAGAVTASAASLGGVTGNSAGADSAAVATCQTSGPIDVDYTMVYSSDDSDYNVDTVELTGVDAACDTLTYYLTISDASGAALADDSGTVALGGGNAMSIDVSAQNADAEAVVNVAIAIASN